MIQVGGPVFSDALLGRLREARRVAALTGAGASAESGIPTFRDLDGGLWKDFDPRDLATPQAFARDPKRVWDWYESRRRAARAVEPNAGHRMLARLEQKIGDVTVVTQNVDGLHQRAGSSRVIELHGSLFRVKCSRCRRGFADWSERGPDIPPKCDCGGLLRPDVVWFGEMLSDRDMREAFRAVTRADVLLVVGTSAVVQPAASLPLSAQGAGAYVLEVNPEATPLTGTADESVLGASGEVLPALWRMLWGE